MAHHRYALHNDHIVAFGFLLAADEQVQTKQNKYTQLFYTAHDARRALACASSEVQAVVCSTNAETAPIGFEVSPLNLAAALHKDDPTRDIYVENSEPSGLFVSRVEAAGARGVVTKKDIECLLGIGSVNPQHPSEIRNALSPRSTEERSDALNNSVDCKDPLSEDCKDPLSVGCDGSQMALSEAEESTATPCHDTVWLEQVLELDDLDELFFGTGPALLERPVHYQAESVDFYEPGLEQLLPYSQRSERDGVVAAFVSGRGGVGKSSLSVLTAFELWRSGSKVVLIDMDLQFGDISILAGNEPESCIQRLSLEQLCEGQIRIHDYEGSLVVLEAPPRPEQAEELVQLIPRLLTALKTVADIILVNTACLWNEAQAVLAGSTDKLVICMDQRATSISAARQVVDLCVRLQIPSTQLCYLLNRTARNAPITDIDASLAMGGVDVITIAEGGADVDELLSLGCPLELLSAQSGLRQSIHRLGALLLKKPGTALERKGSSR